MFGQIDKVNITNYIGAMTVNFTVILNKLTRIELKVVGVAL